MKKEKNIINLGAIISISFILAFMYMLNRYTTYVADDFNNMFIDATRRISSISDIVETQILRYHDTNGRTVAHTIVQLQLLLFNKTQIEILNTIGFGIFIYLTYSMSRISDHIDSNSFIYKKELSSFILILLCFFMFWKFTPVFGQDFLWIIGTANYMWTSILVLLSLIIARRIAMKGGVKRNVFITFIGIILSFLSGWTNENSVPAFMFVLLYYIIKTKREKYDGFLDLILMFTSSLIGFVLMIFAPGNFVRLGAFPESPYFIPRMLNRFDKMFLYFKELLVVLTILAIIFLLLHRILNWRNNLEIEIFFLAGVGAYMAMIMSPTFPARAMISTVYYFIMVILLSLSYLREKNIYAFLIISLGMMIYSGIYFGQTYPDAIKANITYHKQYFGRESNILDKKKKGKLENIEVTALPAENKYMPAYKLGEVSKDKEFWINKSLDRYYGVKSIVLK
ncbi:DUF3329 domain-containing protein [Peptostreptococcus equinus]|uniref:DUF6056 family protein n=1 Tax=Peptostreptococcus equinus TaxID=3003601 RepID=A0ABY7JTE8_9FIRM|nr:DUF6056 family protein [Peptostreptococcus sp. CBA3647]WAW14992.1 DUF6056 family protein [Peptostreptococcus sp. CBA3647]